MIFDKKNKLYKSPFSFGKGLLSDGKIISSVASGPPPLDPDAQAFITAAGITDTTQKNAINTLVVDLKGYGIWSKMKAIYPFVGGTSTSHSYNLKNTLQFQIVWSGGVTHSSTGVTFNGTNGYGNTNLNTNSVSNPANYHQSIYSRTLGGNNSWVDIGNWVTGRINFIQIGNNANTYDNYIFDATSALGISNSGARAMFMANRINTSRKSFRNGVSIQSQTIAVGSNINLNVFIGAVNLNGNASNYIGRNLAFSTIGDGLTDTEASNLYTAVQAYQTTLGRQV